ncbi:hypothetical protein J6Z39_06915 [bacterium]|nr:hypothetical protein [bacterium]
MITQITEFSSEVQEKLKFYVYRLVNPINGRTFYVGKGKGNRLFQHANAVDPNTFYEENKDFELTEENNDPAKIRTIARIKNKGLDVIHIIQRWGMDEKTALEVESAFIDYFGLEHLTNAVKGYDEDRGMYWADELEHVLAAKPFDDYPKCPEFILIKINDYSIGLKDGDIYEAVRASWKINPDIANQYPYILAVRHGIVVGVYRIDENGWKRTEDGKRASFTGKEAEKKIQNIFLNKKIPQRFRKNQNPVSYCDRNLVEAEEKK